jgi:hypothetical protein
MYFVVQYRELAARPWLGGGIRNATEGPRSAG